MENKSNNTITRGQNYNICPRCGRHAYAILMDNGSYRVGCLHCGLKYGHNTLANEEITEAYVTKMRKAWNFKCLEAEYSEDAMEALCVSNGNYVLTDNTDGTIIHISPNMRDVVRYVEETENRFSVGIYIMLENTLEKLGSSFLVWEILNR